MHANVWLPERFQSVIVLQSRCNGLCGTMISSFCVIGSYITVMLFCGIITRCFGKTLNALSGVRAIEKYVKAISREQ